MSNYIDIGTMSEEELEEWKAEVARSFANHRNFVLFFDPEVERGTRAIDLLRRIVNDNPDPFVDTTDYSNSGCFFCVEDSPKHANDCPYLLAKQLLEEIDNGRPQTKIT